MGLPRERAGIDYRIYRLVFRKIKPIRLETKFEAVLSFISQKEEER
jgi:hypothetical protein